MRNDPGSSFCLFINVTVFLNKFDIKHFPDIITTVSEHFNSPGNSIEDFSFMPIDKVTGNWKRLMKETSWMHRLGTVFPFGLNSKIMF